MLTARCWLPTRRLPRWWECPPKISWAGRAASFCRLENAIGYDLCQDESYTPSSLQAPATCEGEALRGKRLIVSITYTPLMGEDGRLLNIVANVHDITRFREEEMKSTFTSIISHELKTPVALIKVMRRRWRGPTPVGTAKRRARD